MRRLLVFVLALVIAGSAMVPPAYACVPTHSIAAKPHPCCPPAITAVPVGPCCIITAPVQRSSTETRIAAPDQTAAVPRTSDGLFWFNQARASRVSPPALRGSPVPLYLQQLSLLI